MKNVNEIYSTPSETKSADYVSLTGELVRSIQVLLSQREDSFALKMFEKEIVSCFRKAEQADCEYTAYINAHAAEVWMAKANDYVLTGKMAI